MARRKPGKSRAKKAARKKTAPKKKAAKKVAKKAAKKVARRAAPKKARIARRAAPAPKPIDRRGLITHTELASTDPSATQAWCESVLGWKFTPPMATPTGPYHMWRFVNDTGGGIRATNPPEPPGAIPYCEVSDIHATFSAALGAGATEMLAPQELQGGMGWIAIVSAPGGPTIGFWAAK